MEKGEKLTGGPYWTQNWIEAMWRFTAERFVDFDTGTVDFEALGREEYEFRKALFFRNFKNSPRAREAFDAAAEDYGKKVANGQKGGRPRKIITEDGDTSDGSQGTRTAAAITRNEPLEHDPLDSSSTISADVPTREDGKFKSDSGNAGNLESATTATISQDAAHRKDADDRKAPTSCNPYDQETCPVSTDEARESRRTEGHSLRVGNVARHSVRSPGRKFRNKEEFIQWAIDTGLDPNDAGDCWEATMERGGLTKDGKKVENLCAYAVKWCRTSKKNRETA